MQFLTVRSLPRILFAHTFSADSYSNSFTPHPDTVEITYISKGSLRYITPGEERLLKSGSVMINTFTRPMRVEAGEYHEHHTACFSLKFDLSDAPGIPLISAASTNRCLNLIDDIIRAHTIEPDSGLKTAGLCLQLLYEISADSDSQSVNLYVQKVKNYIFRHLREPIRQADIARALGITPEYLCAVFKKYENTTVMNYVNRIKLDKIRTVMEQDHLPLHQASELYGYNDPNYVSRLYKKMFSGNISDHLKGKS